DDVGELDTNVARVLARRMGRRLGRAEAQALADALVPIGQGWSWNQAMIELGATCCRPRTAECERCPLAAECAWWSAGRPEPDPATGSAGVSGRQSTFEGSEREGRGRRVDGVRRGRVEWRELAGGRGGPTGE